MDRALRAGVIVLHHALNNDFRVAPLGGDDALNNVNKHTPIGLIRTYAYLGNNFTAQGWIDAIKKGRTYFSSGPLLEFSVNGKRPGEDVKFGAGGGSVDVVAKVWSFTPLRKAVIWRNGREWKPLPVTADRKSRRFSRNGTSGGKQLVYVERRSRPVSGGAGRLPGRHQRCASVRRRAKGSATANRPSTSCSGSIKFKPRLNAGLAGGPTPRNNTSSSSSRRPERCTGSGRGKPLRSEYPQARASLLTNRAPVRPFSPSRGRTCRAPVPPGSLQRLPIHWVVRFACGNLTSP